MSNGYDWLPADWRVEVRVRKSGKKDKFYIQSSTGLKLFSKPEVLRYLNNFRANSHESQETGKISVEGSNKTKVNVSVMDSLFVSSTQSGAEKNMLEELPPGWTQSGAEKNMLEELPPGWIKKIKVTKPGGRIRRDSYYEDPVDGYIFRSKREAFRYLHTRQLGRRIIKSRDKDRSNEEINDDKVSNGQILAHFESTRQTLHINDDSKLSQVVENDKTIESTWTDDWGSLAEHIENPCKEDVAAIKSFNPTEANVARRITSCSKDTENLLLKRTGGITKQGIIMSSYKKPPDLRKCTLKRLAGMKNDSLKRRNDQVSLGHMKNEEGGAEKKSTCTKNKSEDVKMEDPNDYLMMDPCIEFAVKTLKGEIPIEDPPSLDMLLGKWGRDPSIKFDVKTNWGNSIGDRGEGSKQQ